MLSILDKKSGGAKGQNKDLHRLSRQDLLELLVGQMHEGDELRATIAEKDREIGDLTVLSERLKEKLDLKDDQIEHLKEKLNLKDDQIENLKVKLDLKDAQLAHLKGKLDDKDELIAKLTHRLDLKDELIVHLSDGDLASINDMDIFEARTHAAELAARRVAEAAQAEEAEAAQEEEDVEAVNGNDAAEQAESEE